MELAGKEVLIVGAGASGLAAAKLCLARGASVSLTDRAAVTVVRDRCRELKVNVFGAEHSGVEFGAYDVVVVSPGVPDFGGLHEAEMAGALVIGELDLAARFISAPLVIVGGTNGKSTTTVLLGDMLTRAGLAPFVGGNLGTPLSVAALGGSAYSHYVVEASSFQLERAPALRPHVSVLLNVSDDHLDRYDGFDAYLQAKGNAFELQTERDVAVVPHGDAPIAMQARRGDARVVTFGDGADFRVEGQVVVDSAAGTQYPLAGTLLAQRPGALNAAAAIAAARAVGAAPAAIQSALKDFVGLPHRVAMVQEVGGVRFYDDSKATNVGAAVSAVRGLAEPRAVVIAGGRDKLGEYEPLVRALVDRARAVVLIGEAAARIEAAIAGRVPVVHAESMMAAVRVARELAETGDAVLLSPACSSFDMFSGYAARGEAFASAVLNLNQSSKDVG